MDQIEVEITVEHLPFILPIDAGFPSIFFLLQITINEPKKQQQKNENV